VKSSEEIGSGFDRPATRTRSIAAPVRTTTRSIKIDREPTDSRGIRIVAKEGGENVEVRIVPGSAQNFDNILFKLGSASLADETSARQLKEIAKAMVERPKLRFLVEGHTCDLGTDESNKLLSEQRAEAVRDFLLKQKVKPEQVFTLGFGELSPLERNTSESNRAKNRRVAVYLRDVAEVPGRDPAAP
jgi:outer membrane protein OmpA-like peptidoglycan-associated protein